MMVLVVVLNICVFIIELNTYILYNGFTYFEAENFVEQLNKLNIESFLGTGWHTYDKFRNFVISLMVLFRRSYRIVQNCDGGKV